MVLHATPSWIDTPVFILGLPRSGTSMVAGLLRLSGLWLGTTVPGGVAENRMGFFENIVLREQVTKPILARLGCDPLGVRSLPRLDRLPDGAGLRPVVEQAICSEGYRGERPWGYKDAKTTLLWPLWRQAFPGAVFLIVKRDPEEVIQSCMRTGFMQQHSRDPQFWRRFVAEYESRLTQLHNSGARVLPVNSGEVVRGDLSNLCLVIEQLELKCDVEATTGLSMTISGMVNRRTRQGRRRNAPSMPVFRDIATGCDYPRV